MHHISSVTNFSLGDNVLPVAGFLDDKSMYSWPYFQSSIREGREGDRVNCGQDYTVVYKNRSEQDGGGRP